MFKLKTKILLSIALLLTTIPITTLAALYVEVIPVTQKNLTSATLVGVLMDDAFPTGVSTEYVKFRYTTTSSTSCANMTTETAVQTINLDFQLHEFYNFQQQLNSLTPHTKYYFCAVASSEADFSANVLYSGIRDFTTELPPDLADNVVTGTASNITQNGATIYGEIYNDHSTPIFGKFKYSENYSVSCASLPNAINTPVQPPGGVGASLSLNFSHTLTNLKSSTTYSYCAVGDTNSDFPNAIYGEVKVFTTPPSASGNPEDIGPVDTQESTEMDDNEVTLQGNYSGGAPGFAYFRLTSATVPPLFCNDIYGSDMIGITSNEPDPIGYTTGGDFSVHVNGLEPETTYFYCAIVSNNALTTKLNKLTYRPQIKYGSVKSFRTLPCLTCNITQVTTLGSNVIDSQSVNLKGSYRTSRPVKIYFEYSKDFDVSTPPTSGNVWIPTNPPKLGGFNSYGNYNFLLTGLDSNTKYSFRIVGELAIGGEIIYGSTLDFTTDAYDGVDPIITEDPVDDVPVEPGGEGGGDDNCPAGTIGIFPDCTVGEIGCPAGYEGVPPDCVNLGGGSGDDDAPVVEVTADPIFVDPGQSSTITWTSTNATSCVLNGYDIPTSGSADTGALNTSKSYSVICTGPGGVGSDNAQVYVNITGGGGGGDIIWVKALAAPVFVTTNSSSVVSWQSSGAEFCESGGHGNGTSGSFNTGPLTSSMSYTISCSGQSGSAASTAYIETHDPVTPPSCFAVPQTQSLQCPAGQVGLILQSRSSTCPDPNGSPVWSNWETVTNSCQSSSGGPTPPSCFAVPQTQSLQCPAGQVGLILQSRSSTCPDPNGSPVWSNWETVTNSCQSSSGGPTPPSCFAVPQTQSLQCPAGQVGLILQSRSSTCPDPNGSPVWSNWETVTNSCQSSSGGPGGPGSGVFPPGPGNPWSPTGPGGPGGPNGNGGTNPTLPQGPDNDGDGLGNPNDDDTDGDWDPNGTDTDDDGDGIPDLVDATPNGPGNSDDLDGNGVGNDKDNDIDGDGVPNYLDNDTDADGIPNATDSDDDGDGIPDWLDPLPKGPHGDKVGVILGVGDEAIPPSDAIVHYNEGVETVFARQIRNRNKLSEKLGYSGRGNLESFAQNMAHTLSRYYFGYVDESGKEVRVSVPDVSAYELRIVGNKLAVYEYYRNKIIDIRVQSIQFKSKNPYEYYFQKRF